MTDSKKFTLEIMVRDETIKVPVCQASYPNGYIIYKLFKKPGTIWLLNLDGSWKTISDGKPDEKTLYKIIQKLINKLENRHLYLV